MNFPEFIKALLLDGNIVVGTFAEVKESELTLAKDRLQQFETEYRLECPGIPPSFSSDWSCWAGLKFFRACQFALFRELDQPTMDREFQLLGNGPAGADSTASSEIHYSVDLIFRFLGDLLKLTTQLSREDPLVVHLESEALRWPLSSVGIAEIQCRPHDEIFANECLRQIYVDRIIRTQDKDRIDSPAIRDQVRISLGENSPWSKELAKLEF